MQILLTIVSLTGSKLQGMRVEHVVGAGQGTGGFALSEPLVKEERGHRNGADAFQELAEVHAKLKVMLINVVIYAHLRRAYAKALDDLFTSSPDGPLPEPF